jgi:L-ascorbate metabolism protein UlaG (beta-lactamase superfamily)
MKEVRADVAFLPIADRGAMMGPKEAARAAEAIDPQMAVPIHWQERAEVEMFAAAYSGETRILEPGREY